MGGEQSEKLVLRGMKEHIYIEELYGPEAIEFYKIVFGATELSRVTKTIKTSDKIKGTARFESCELMFGPSSIIVAERSPDSSVVGMSSAGNTIELKFEEIESIIADAKELGAVECGSVEIDQSGLGCRAVIKDPYGIKWIITTPPRPVQDIN